MNSVILGGKTLRIGDVFEVLFHRDYKNNLLYLLARDDNGLVIMPRKNSKIYEDAKKGSIISAKCRLRAIMKTQRNTFFAIADPLEWTVIVS